MGHNVLASKMVNATQANKEVGSSNTVGSSSSTGNLGSNTQLAMKKQSLTTNTSVKGITGHM